MSQVSEKIRTRCPYCQRKLKIKSRAAGTDQCCPSCGGSIHVPEATPQQGPPPIPNVGVQQTAADRKKRRWRWPASVSVAALIGFAFFLGVWNLATHESDLRVEHDHKRDDAPQIPDEVYLQAAEYRARTEEANRIAWRRGGPAWQRERDRAAERQSHSRRVNRLRAEKRFNDAIDNYLAELGGEPKTVSGLIEAVREPYEAMGKYPR